MLSVLLINAQCDGAEHCPEFGVERCSALRPSLQHHRHASSAARRLTAVVENDPTAAAPGFKLPVSGMCCDKRLLSWAA